MGQFGKWILHEDQKETFEYLWANVLNLIFLALAALLLWPMGRASLALRLAKGYWVFWVVLFVTAMLLLLFRRLFRVDMDSNFDAYLLSALAVSGLLQAGWSAFAALVVGDFVAGSRVWAAIALYSVGLVSCWVAFGIVSALYMGSFYRNVNLILAPVTYAVFCAWPAAARALFGWFFDLFGFFTLF